VEIIAMCDIDNPPFGERGAAKVFAPQKGADESAVELLDEGVKSLCCLIKEHHGVDLSTLKGGGAAGALGAGMNFFFGAQLKMGIDTVLEVVEFDKVIEDADLILTGEGKIDSQSLGGKVVIGVARAGKRKNVPVLAVVGGADGDMEKAYEEGVSAIFTINKLPQDFSISRYNSESNLKFAVDNLLRALKLN
jgi:glycerate kinase